MGEGLGEVVGWEEGLEKRMARTNATRPPTNEIVINEGAHGRSRRPMTVFFRRDGKGIFLALSFLRSVFRSFACPDFERCCFFFDDPIVGAS